MSNEFDGPPTILVRRPADSDVQATEQLFAKRLDPPLSYGSGPVAPTPPSMLFRYSPTHF
jgi:hypothetical protein